MSRGSFNTKLLPTLFFYKLLAFMPTHIHILPQTLFVIYVILNIDWCTRPYPKVTAPTTALLIRPIDPPTFAGDEGVGYKCNHCFTQGLTVEADSKLTMVRHLRESHVPDFVPWHCPICQFKCTYPPFTS